MGTDKGDRLEWVRIEGFRSIEDVTIQLCGLQVLIGENGAGKSTILEAFEILSKVITEPRFAYDLANRHGDIRDLIRLGAREIRLSTGATIVGLDGPASVDYSLGLRPAGTSVPVIHEELRINNVVHVSRSGADARVAESFGSRGAALNPTNVTADSTMLGTYWGQSGPSVIRALQGLLRGVRLHLPFDTRPAWARPEGRDPVVGPRSVPQLAEGTRLDRGGGNLVSVFQRLRNNPLRFKWAEIMLEIRAALGPDILDVVVEVKPVGGYAELRLVIQGLGTVSASQLSDGQLSYLALVALAHLQEEDTVLLFDEPELHLNPALLARATWLFERIAHDHPVILATHADAVLDALDSEAESVRVVQLDGERRTVVRKLSAERLKVWSDRYATVSELRREGLLSDVVEIAQ